MLPRADLGLSLATTVNPVGRANTPGAAAPLGDGRQELFERSLAGLVGKSVQAEVLSKFTDGSYLVKIGDTAARLPLPSGVQVGGKVDLTLLALTPRPTFQISANIGGTNTLATAEAAPAGGRAEPLVYLDGAHPAPGAGQNGAGAGLAGAGAGAGADAHAGAQAGAAAAGGAGGAGGAGAAGAAGAGAGAAGAGLAGGAQGAANAAGTGPGSASALATTAAQAAAAGAPTAAGAGGAGAAGASAGAGTGAANAAAASAAANAATAAATHAGQAALAGQAGRAGALPGAAPADAAAQARAATPGALLLAKAPLVPADQLPSIDPKSTPASFSPAARLLASVLTSAAETGTAQRAIAGGAPLADSPQVAPEKLATALKDALGNSGLFYESHVAEWAAGARPMAALAQEPQMRAAPDTRQPGAPDPATAQLINQQLSTAEQGRVAWQGQAWPGQAMQWEVSRDAPERERDDTGDASTPVWRSGLRLQFPVLGDLRASIVMVGDALHIDIASADGDAGAQLRARAGELSDALAAAGLPLSSLRIRDAGADAPAAATATAAAAAAATGTGTGTVAAAMPRTVNGRDHG